MYRLITLLIFVCSLQGIGQTQTIDYRNIFMDIGNQINTYVNQPTSFTGKIGLYDSSSIATCEWDFNGDGIYDKIQDSLNTTYTYTKTGLYLVTCKITTNKNTFGIAKVHVKVLSGSGQQEYVDYDLSSLPLKSTLKDGTPPTYYLDKYAIIINGGDNITSRNDQCNTTAADLISFLNTKLNLNNKYYYINRNTPDMKTALTNKINQLEQTLKNNNQKIRVLYVITIGHGGGFQKNTKKLKSYYPIFACFDEYDEIESKMAFSALVSGVGTVNYTKFDANGDGDFDDLTSIHESIDLNGTKLKDTELAILINKIPTDNSVVIMDNCYSGGFINNLNAQNRIIMTAASEFDNSYASSYSQDFIHSLINTYIDSVSMVEWFYNGLKNYRNFVNSISTSELEYATERNYLYPQFEDNNDGFPITTKDEVNGLDELWKYACLGKIKNAKMQDLPFTRKLREPFILSNFNNSYFIPGLITSTQKIDFNSRIKYRAGKAINLTTGFKATADETNFNTSPVLNAKIIDYGCFRSESRLKSYCINSHKLSMDCFDINFLYALDPNLKNKQGKWISNNIENVWFIHDEYNNTTHVRVFAPGTYKITWATSYNVLTKEIYEGYEFNIEFKDNSSCFPGTIEKEVCGFSTVPFNGEQDWELVPNQTLNGNIWGDKKKVYVNAPGEYMIQFYKKINGRNVRFLENIKFKCNCPGFNPNQGLSNLLSENCNYAVPLNSKISVGSGNWSLLSKTPSDATITNWGIGQSNPNTTATVNKDGTYNFRWTQNPGTGTNECIVPIYFDQKVIVKNIGNSTQSQTINTTENYFDLRVYEPAYPNGQWQIINSPANSNATVIEQYKESYNNITTYSNYTYKVDKSGYYRFKWSGNNICNGTNYFADVTIGCKDITEEIICGDKYYTRIFNNDFPFIEVSKPDEGNIIQYYNNAYGNDDIIMVDLPGNYLLNNVNNNFCNTEYTHNLTFKFPVERVKFNGQVCGNTFNLDANPTESGEWSIKESPANASATFTDYTNPSTLVTVNKSGKYVFRWKEFQCGDPAIYANYDFYVEFVLSGNREFGVITLNDVCGNKIELIAQTNGNPGLWTCNKSTNIVSWGNGQDKPYTTVTVNDKGSYSFTWTENNPNCNSTKDIYIVNATILDKVILEDNSEMPIVGIGCQCWFAKNLDMGTQLNLKTNHQLQQNNNLLEKYCYDDDPFNCIVNSKGALYIKNEALNWDINNNQGICPTGWHIPTLEEIQLLSSYAGGKANPLTVGGSLGFNAVGTGLRIAGSFSYNGQVNDTYIWSSTQRVDGNSYTLTFNATPGNTSNISFGGYSTDCSMSVRCIKDSPFKSSINNTAINDDNKDDGDLKKINLISSKIYPNPAKDYFILTLKDNIDLIKVELFSATGSKVHTETLYNEGGIINLPNLNKGFYIVRVYSQTETFSEVLLIE